MQNDFLDLKVQDARVRLAYHRRPGPGPVLISLHGFGSTKEDYADLALRDDFADCDLIAWDAPVCGVSELDQPDALSIPFLVEVSLAACDALDIKQFHLTGHSMGGLTALMMAHEHPDRVLSFFNIEGNIASEDCFLSRQIIDYPADTAEDFFRDFQTRVKSRTEYGSALYASTLPLKVRTTTVEPVFRSMVSLSDTKPLMEMFTGLSCPKAFVYGVQNRHLSYLGRLQASGVQVIEIPHAGHFPMYTNPPALWSELHNFLTGAE